MAASYSNYQTKGMGQSENRVLLFTALGTQLLTNIHGPFAAQSLLDPLP